MRIKGKQVNKYFSGYIRVSGTSVTGLSSNVTLGITSALLGAGHNSQNLTLAPSVTANTGGIVTNAPYNRVEIFDSNSKEKIVSTGEEVYGRITEAIGVYTLSFYFKDNNGIETVHNFSIITPIDYEFLYRFQFGELPTEIFVGLTSRNVVTDAGGSSNGTDYSEITTVTGIDTLASLNYSPTGPDDIILYVNSKPEFAIGATPSFSVVGTSVTWLAANAGYSIDPTDVVTSEYKTLDI